jgi:peptidoglycan/xylan/chitin deacetylase (PgdA/CDA1 family)
MSSGARLYGPKASGVAIAIAAGSLLLLIAMLRVLIGPFEFLHGAAPAPGTVHLWEPPSTLGDPEWKKVERFETWRAALPAGVTLAATKDLRTESRGVVVVDDASRLTQAEIAQLVAHIEAGGGAVLAGWVGAHGDSGPGENMRALLGVERVEIVPPEQAYFAAVGGRGPLSAGLAPGERADLTGALASPAVDDPRAELYWSSWSLHAVEPASGAALRMPRGAGRLAWIGIEPARAGRSPHTRAVLSRVYANAVAWAGGEPVAELLPWPGGAPLAGVLAMDTEEGFVHASEVARRARADGFPITFLLLSSVAQRYSTLVAELAAAGELGSHADVHDGFRDVGEAEQRQRLERTRAQLAELGVADVRGFRPPFESYDAATLRALIDAGFDYMLGDAEQRGMAPVLVQPEGAARALVQIPRAMSDDYDLFVRRSISDPDELREALRVDVERARDLGGLYYFSFHSQFMDTPERLEALAWLAAELRRQGAWLATAGQVADWWRRRAKVDSAVARAGPRRLRVRVTNRGPDPVRELALRVYPNAPIASVQASASQLFQATPELRAGGDFVDLLLPELPAGASRDYALDFELDPAGEPGPVASAAPPGADAP